MQFDLSWHCGAFWLEFAVFTEAFKLSAKIVQFYLSFHLPPLRASSDGCVYVEGKLVQTSFFSALNYYAMELPPYLSM